MDTLIYRDALASDLPQIVAIYNSTIPSRMVTADTELVSVDSKQAWFDAHHPAKRPLWVVENEHKAMMGWVSFQSFYGRPAYDATVEISIYVESGQRGKGFGKRILQYALDKSPDFGVRTVLGFIFSHNEASLQLFRGLGFEDWGVLPRVALLDGQEKSLHIVGKRIACVYFFAHIGWLAMMCA